MVSKNIKIIVGTIFILLIAALFIFITLNKPQFDDNSAETCSEKKLSINAELSRANYCIIDSDCIFFQPNGYSCWQYINKKYNTTLILNQIQKYLLSGCTVPAYKCQRVCQPQCINGKCENVCQ